MKLVKEINTYTHTIGVIDPNDTSFKIGDVVYIDTQNLIAVIRDRNEYVCLIEFIHRYKRRTYRALHAIGWMYAHAFKIDI